VRVVQQAIRSTEAALRRREKKLFSHTWPPRRMLPSIPAVRQSAAERMDAHESDHEVDSLRRKIEDMGASTARRINDMARRHEEAIKLHQEEIRLLKEQNRRQDEEIRLLKQQLQRPLAGHASSTRAPRDEDYTLIEAPR